MSIIHRDNSIWATGRNHSKTYTQSELLMMKAKEDYPIGTEFVCPNGNHHSHNGGKPVKVETQNFTMTTLPDSSGKYVPSIYYKNCWILFKGIWAMTVKQKEEINNNYSLY